MKEASILHIGFDDTDSRKGMCTTFLAYKIVEYLKKEKVKFQINTEYIIFYNRRFNKNLPPKSIKLIYKPSDIDKERNLSSQLQCLKIYSQKIVSKKYKL